MRTTKVIHLVSCHAEGEVGNVIVGGVPPPPGDTIWEQSRWIARDQSLRNFVLNEPRGGVFKHINLLVPPKHPDAAYGFIVMEPMHTPPMSGSNSICVATVLLDTGMVEMQEPVTTFCLEAPAGLVKVRAHCEDGKARSIEVQNVPSFVVQLGAELELDGVGKIAVDIAYGGDSFVLLDARALGFEIVPDEALRLAQTGARIVAAANEQIGFQHPIHREWNQISFCQFTLPVERDGEKRWWGAIPSPLIRASWIVLLAAPAVQRVWRCFMRAAKWAWAIISSAARSSIRVLTAKSKRSPMLPGVRRSCPAYEAAPGLPVLSN